MNHRTRAQNRPSGNVHGVLVVDKPRGPTSHDVVAQVRRIFGTRRVGHAGTLDPMATGVLVVLLGEATKLSSVLSTDRKVYEAELSFGTSTDTLDAEGKITKKRELVPGWLGDEALALALAGERARRLQIPPQVSAIKIGGKPAYALARKGERAELAPRQVAVHALDVLSQETHKLRLRLDVSKGYYVRALARDLGDALCVPSHLSALCRTASGPFILENAHPWPPEPNQALLSVDEAAALCLPRLDVSAEGATRLRQGKPLGLEHLTTPPVSEPPGRNPELWAAFFQDHLLALVEQRQTSEFRVRRGIHSLPRIEQGLHDPSPKS